MAQIWREDPAPYGDVTDGYGQWSMGAGHKFETTRDIPAEAAGDFDYMIGAPVPGEAAFFGRLPIRAASAGPLSSGDTLPAITVPAIPLDPRVDKDRLTLVGVIDSGINVAHRRFRTSDGTSRVAGAWIMDADHGGGTPFGRHLTGLEIAAAVASHRDEDALFAALGLTGGPGYRPSPLAQRVAHGTHVADTAAGYPPEADRHDIQIAAVSLPVFAVQDTSGAGLLVPILAGIAYIYANARALSQAYGQAVPVVLNMSFGFRAGAANGQHVIERALRAAHDGYVAEMTATYGASAPVATTVSAGNGHLAQSFCTGGARAFATTLMIQPADRTASFVEIWVPSAANRIKLTLTAPGGAAEVLNFRNLNPATPPKAQIWTDAAATDAGAMTAAATARVSVEAPAPATAPAPEPRWRVLIALGPSADDRTDGLSVPHGAWQLHLNARDASGGRPDGSGLFARIQRDEGLMGFARHGRQPYFTDAAYEASTYDPVTGDLAVTDAGTSRIRHNGTVSGTATNPATAKASDVIAVGASRWDTGGASIYSAAGMGAASAPDVMAVGDTSRVSPGIMGAGARGTAPVTLNGTSVAAPQAARLLSQTIASRAPADYPGFSPRAWLAAQAATPTRPTATNPERPGSNAIRAERVQAGLLPVPRDLAGSVARGGMPKH
ncbi:MAG: S8 family serine peptidase [Pseudomonadota bacterium]